MTELSSLAGAQALVIAVVLLTAGLVKLPRASVEELVRRSALTAVIGPRPSRACWRAVAGVEAAVGALILALPGLQWPLVLAAAVLALGVAYTLAGQLIRPGSPCGCFGRMSASVHWWHSALRTGVLLVLCGLALRASQDWPTAVSQSRTWALLAFELVALVWLSPEHVALGRGMRGRARAWRTTIEKWRLGADCVRAEGPPAAETIRLAKTDLWTRVSSYLSGDEASDIWREGCWEFAAFAGRYRGGPATVVFGIPLDPVARVSTVAVVDDTDGAVVVREELLRRA